jgi:hypothetical protein
MAIAVLQSPAGTGDFQLRVEPRAGTGALPSPSETTSEPESCAQWQAAMQAQESEVSDPQCAQSTGPGGEKVLAVSVRHGQIITFDVLVWRPDSLVSVSARNCWNGWESDRPDQLPAPAATHPQTAHSHRGRPPTGDVTIKIPSARHTPPALASLA